MALRKYRRPDGAEGTHVVTLAVTVWSDGSYSGVVSAWEPGGERMRHYTGLKGTTDGSVAPRGLEALQSAAQDALDQWGAGKLV